MCCINSLFVSQLSVQKTPPLLPAAIFTERKDVDLNSDPQTASGSVWTYTISSSAARPAVRVPGLGAGILRRRGSSAQQKRGAREASRYTGQGGKDAAELTEGFTTEKQLVLASLAAVDHLFIMRRLCAHSGGTDIQGSGKITQGCLAKKLLNQVQQSGRLGEQKCTFHPLSHAPSLLL